MKSVATIKLKISNNKILLETMKQYSNAMQIVVDCGWSEGIYFKRDLHDLTYYSIRENSNLPAQLVCSSRDKACEILKAQNKRKTPTKPKVKDFMSIRYDARSFTFKTTYVSLVTTKGRIKIPLQIPEYFWKYLDWKVCSADLVRDRDKLFFNITFSRDVNIDNISCRNNKVVGVDVGINNVAVTSNRQFFNASQIKRKRIYFKKLRAKLQSKGTRSSQRLLKKISGREQRFIKYWNHKISKEIVSSCNAGDTIALENIKGIRNQRKGRKFNFWLQGWSYYQLQSFIAYKALNAGVKTIKVSPYMTSQTCSKCGQIGSRSKGFFCCSHCNYSLNADLNASFNLAKHHSIADGVSVAVIQPNIQANEHKGSVRTIVCEVMDKSPLL